MLSSFCRVHYFHRCDATEYNLIHADGSLMQDVGLVEMELAHRRILSEQKVNRGQQIARAAWHLEPVSVVRLKGPAVITAFNMRLKIQRSNHISCVRLTLNNGLLRISD